METKTTVRAGYNQIAAKYLASRSVDSEDVRLLDALVERLSQGAQLLDAGCGAGVPITKRLSQSFDVTGVDFAEAQLQLARELVPQGKFVRADLTQLPFADNSFDAVCSYYAIIHIPREEHRTLVENLNPILKPSGWVLLCLGAGDLEDDTDENYFGMRMYWSHYDADTNLRMLEECGFEVIGSKIVADFSSPGAGHLFALAQKVRSHQTLRRIG